MANPKFREQFDVWDTLASADPGPFPKPGGGGRAHSRRLSQTLFMLTDLGFIWLSALVALGARFPESFRFGAGDVGLPNLAAHLGFVVVYSALVVLFCDTRRLYGGTDVRSLGEEARAIFGAVATASLLITALFYLSGIRTISRIILVLTAVLTLLTLIGWRYWRRQRIMRQVAAGHNCRNILIVGTGQVGRALGRYLNQHKQIGYLVKGFLTCDELDLFVLQPERIDEMRGSPPVLGHVDGLCDLARAHFVDDVFISVPHERELVKKVAAEARLCGISVRVVPDLYDGLAWGAPIEYLGYFPILPLHEPHVPLLGFMLKRVIDVLASAAALVLLAPLMAAIALAIRLASPGPILYRSERIGKKGKTFTCYKFRSMVRNAEELKNSMVHLNARSRVLFKIPNDPRTTPLGRFLRKYSLDELPQFWNVLKGDMSLVGPRPPVAGEYEQYSLEHLRRLDVLPGITGLWQVKARTNPSFENYISLDVEYITKWDLWLDLRIMLKTVAVILTGTGQ